MEMNIILDSVHRIFFLTRIFDATINILELHRTCVYVKKSELKYVPDTH